VRPGFSLTAAFEMPGSGLQDPTPKTPKVEEPAMPRPITLFTGHEPAAGAFDAVFDKSRQSGMAGSA